MNKQTRQQSRKHGRIPPFEYANFGAGWGSTAAERDLFRMLGQFAYLCGASATVIGQDGLEILKITHPGGVIAAMLDIGPNGPFVRLFAASHARLPGYIEALKSRDILAAYHEPCLVRYSYLAKIFGGKSAAPEQTSACAATDLATYQCRSRAWAQAHGLNPVMPPPVRPAPSMPASSLRARMWQLRGQGVRVFG